MSVTVAAVGDIHVGADRRGIIGTSLSTAAAHADLLLLAGDLTRCGTVDEMHMVVDELCTVNLPTIAVLGNHDLHSDMGNEISEILEAGGITVLDRSGVVVDVKGVRVGIAGAIGFGGGFDGAVASDFGEREMKSFVERSRREADGLADALADLDCAKRIALTHYSPIAETLEGERREIYPFLGSELLGAAIDRAGADVALHGHAHGGVEVGTTPAGVPVRNVAMPVIRRPYCLFTIDD
jgi:Icc-related predicted phosphoesterase